MDESFASAMKEGELALRARARGLSARGEHAQLLSESRQIEQDGAPSVAAPLAAVFALLGKEPERAIALYERWLTAKEAPAAYHLAHLANAYRKIDDPAGVYRTVARFHPWDLDSKQRLRASKALAWARKQGIPEDLRRVRVALLPTFTPTTMEACLRVGAVAAGVELEIHEVDMDLTRAMVSDPASALYRFDPELVILATTHHDLRGTLSAEEQAETWVGLWDVLLERTSAQIVQHTFDRPAFEPLGHLALRNPGTVTAVANDVNQRLVAAAGSRVSLVDYASVVADFGAHRWTDSRQWYWAKEAVVPEAMPHLVEEYLAVLRAMVGKTKKVLVLDLDNTVWGGIVGEDGLEGLSVGPPSVDGEAHRALQRYAKALKERGVLLAVCSKNNPADAREPFEKLPEMVLKLDDFVAFEASWEPKPTKVRAMAESLNLGLDSFVFVDDNPAERARMLADAPEVLTIPVSDPAGYVGALHRARAFDVLAVSAEDGARTAAYQAETQRKAVRATASPEEYYRSLEMVAAVEPFGPANQARVVQLAARSNQFNLTTWRISTGDVAAIMASPVRFGRVIRLSDRYGDYGLVMVFVADVVDAVLDITALFMSCRVIARTVETLALAQLESLAAENGCTALQGTYIPTKKNKALVSDLYARLGFECVDEAPDGTTRWRRELDLDALTTNPYIAIRERE